jgi:hypothetical protein
MTTQRIPWWAYPLLLAPKTIQSNLGRLKQAGLVDEPPNLWQLSLGVVRMWHRLAFRSDTVGTCTNYTVRKTWRARLLEKRPFRFPFLVAERAVAPLDLTGLVSSRERLIKHLMGAHHDGVQFVYDLEILSCHPGALEELHERVTALITRDDARSRWLRDLTVYENYHENLEQAVAAAIERGIEVPADRADDPDLSFGACMRWCAAQPATPAQTVAAWRAGAFQLAPAEATA